MNLLSVLQQMPFIFVPLLVESTDTLDIFSLCWTCKATRQPLMEKQHWRLVWDTARSRVLDCLSIEWKTSLEVTKHRLETFTNRGFFMTGKTVSKAFGAKNVNAHHRIAVAEHKSILAIALGPCHSKRNLDELLGLFGCNAYSSTIKTRYVYWVSHQMILHPTNTFSGCELMFVAHRGDATLITQRAIGGVICVYGRDKICINPRLIEGVAPKTKVGKRKFEK
jgi:hypothetical protein